MEMAFAKVQGAAGHSKNPRIDSRLQVSLLIDKN
jgi:hypothetical protein